MKGIASRADLSLYRCPTVRPWKTRPNEREKRDGSELASTSYSRKTLLRDGVSVSNGSDCPVELPDVMRGIECAVTRTSLDGTGPYLPAEAFTIREALDSYTIRRSGDRHFLRNYKALLIPAVFYDIMHQSKDVRGRKI